MATYTPVPRSVPSAQRVVEITAVAAGDQIDLRDALGRPARKVQFHVSAATDVVDYRLNSLKRLRTQRSPAEAFSKTDQVYGIYDTTETELWAKGTAYPVFSSTGSTVLETGDGLQVESLEIDALTGPATITVIAW